MQEVDCLFLPPVGVECEALWSCDSDPKWYSWRLISINITGVTAHIDGFPEWFNLSDKVRPLPDMFRKIKAEDGVVMKEIE